MASPRIKFRYLLRCWSDAPHIASRPFVDLAEATEAYRELCRLKRPEDSAQLIDQKTGKILFSMEETRMEKQTSSCTRCGGPNDNGEGYDGLCGSCADQATHEKWACPKCKSIDLEVVVSVWATLTQKSEDEFETDTSTPDDSSHEWDGNSLMKCTDCGHTAESSEFQTEEESPSFRARLRALLKESMDSRQSLPYDAIRDLQTEARHLCDEWELDYGGLDKEAYQVYREERAQGLKHSRTLESR